MKTTKTILKECAELWLYLKAEYPTEQGEIQLDIAGIALHFEVEIKIIKKRLLRLTKLGLILWDGNFTIVIIDWIESVRGDYVNN